MSKNICHFVPYHKNDDAVRTFHYVLETEAKGFSGLTSRAVNVVHFVKSGKGLLHTAGKEQELKPGDIFFTFPAMQYAIESTHNLEYIYISYLGTRANQLHERTGVTYRSFYFENCNDLKGLWESGLQLNTELTDIISESILLYTLSYISNRQNINHTKEQSDTFNRIKKFIDDQITNPELSLKMIATQFKYNEKYVSGLFKQNMGITLVNYINIVRVQLACTMMEQGFSGISDISYSSGFRDPLYFSKVFKKKMGYSPKQHIAEIKKKQA